MANYSKATPITMKNKLFTSALCAASLIASPVMAADQELYFYNWSEYIPNEVLEDFTKETGIKVIYSTYESNESMYAKLKTQASGYDLVVPSTYFVSKMRKEGMLQQIDHKKLPNYDGLDSNFLNKPFVSKINSIVMISVALNVIPSCFGLLWNPDGLYLPIPPPGLFAKILGKDIE